jgi:hypothetical protein
MCCVWLILSLFQFHKKKLDNIRLYRKKEYENGKIWNICRQSIQILKMNNRWKAGKVFVVFSIFTNTLTMKYFPVKEWVDEMSREKEKWEKIKSHKIFPRHWIIFFLFFSLYFFLWCISNLIRFSNFSFRLEFYHKISKIIKS